LSSTPFEDALRRPFWLDDLPAREPYAPLEADAEADLCIVGGGFTGLWAAVRAKQLDPAREVVLLEQRAIGSGASGRNGGFTDSSLTHGLDNGLARFATEMPAIERLAIENWAGFCDDIAAHGIECDLEQTGSVVVSVEPHQDAWLEDEVRQLGEHGYEAELLDGPAMRTEVASPTYRMGSWQKDRCGLVHPGRLASGLAAAAARHGVRIHEQTAASRLERTDGGVRIHTPRGAVAARKVLLATNAYPGLVRSIGRYVIPVYDYVLVTEPLSTEQRRAVGWQNGQGLSDAAHQFHYYRPTPDGRILWGGYDAVYRRTVRDAYDDHEPTFAKLSQHFFATFPQLEGIRFSHRWGGAIDTCSRFSVFFGTAHAGRVAYAAGYTGLGVVAARFGAHVALDLLDGRETEATRLSMVRRKPTPFPPEPIRTGVIELTRNRIAAADRNAGRRGLWLRTLDRLGLGFDS
jgi:glycine/D-amino acid oxidase-like deaminating enzyme